MEEDFYFFLFLYIILLTPLFFSSTRHTQDFINGGMQYATLYFFYSIPTFHLLTFFSLYNAGMCSRGMDNGDSIYQNILLVLTFWFVLDTIESQKYDYIIIYEKMLFSFTHKNLSLFQ